MRIAIVGGSGFLGKNFTYYLLKNSKWNIAIISHSTKEFPLSKKDRQRVAFITADVFNIEEMTKALNGCDVAYYFVHMMGQKDGDLYALEEKAAYSFKSAIEGSSVKRLIFMGGLGGDSDKLSKHLASRHKTGKILRSLDREVIEFQASMVIGRGSVAFDIIANLVDKLPVMPLPKSSTTLTQPIRLEDALVYLYLAARVSITDNVVVQIGGPTILSYEELYRMYAKASSKKRIIIRTPFIPAVFEAFFLDIFTPTIHARIGKAMVESLGNEMIVTSDNARTLFPKVEPKDIEPEINLLAK